MEPEPNPLEAVRALMIDNLEKSRRATQSYLDLVEQSMRGFPNVSEQKVGEFRAYLEQQVAANHAFVDKLLHAKDFPEAFRIQAEYLQSQIKAAAENATQLGTKIATSFKRSTS